MRMLVLAVGSLIAVAANAANEDTRFERTLKMLAIDERLEQLCDYTAMMRIREDNDNFRPDRALASVTSEPRMKEHTLIANGAAFRSRGKWYALSFSCIADAEHMKVLNFKFTVGSEIPEAKWTAYGLWD